MTSRTIGYTVDAENNVNILPELCDCSEFGDRAWNVVQFAL